MRTKETSFSGKAKALQLRLYFIAESKQLLASLRDSRTEHATSRPFIKDETAAEGQIKSRDGTTTHFRRKLKRSIAIQSTEETKGQVEVGGMDPGQIRV